MSISKHQKYKNAIFKKNWPFTVLLCETKGIEYQICMYIYIYMHLFLQCFLQREMMLIFSETGKNDYHQICYHLRHIARFQMK